MKISEKIPSKLEIVPKFISEVINKIRILDIPQDELFNIKLSLEEALVNAIKYGNKMDSSLFVEVSLEFDSEKLRIEIKDQGNGFNFENLIDPTREENLGKTSGRGVFLIKNLMDKVEFSQGGRQITMVKFLKMRP